MSSASTTDGKTIPEPAPQWYHSNVGFFGNMTIHYLASAIYAVIALVPIFLLALGKIDRDFVIFSTWTLPWALFVVLIYPAWSWLETIAFENWVRQLDVSRRKVERQYYNLMMSHAKSFWTSLLAIYSIAGIWGILTK